METGKGIVQVNALEAVTILLHVPVTSAMKAVLIK